MGFPVAYTELLIPKLFLNTLSVLSFIRKLISTLFYYLGIRDFLEPDIPWAQTHQPESHTRFAEFDSVSTMLILEFLPVAKFSDLVDPPDSCSVCLYEFEADDEIRRLTNCRHIFHKGCLDRWMAYEQKTCPLCRSRFIPADLQSSFNDMIWAASEIPESYGEYSYLAAVDHVGKARQYLSSLLNFLVPDYHCNYGEYACDLLQNEHESLSNKFVESISLINSRIR